MPEILAPVGNMDMLRAAVINGADAVYLGLNKFSARSKAVGYAGDELKNAIEYAHLYGVKVYGAINTIIKNEEVDDALNAVAEALNYKIDALILQDLGLVGLIRAKYPTAVLHASTQMGIHNLEGAIVAQKLGFSRIILSRETLLEDIIKIKQGVDIELECFVQGALCIAFSGNCYFSSFASGYSGNRGKCMQLCRKRYSANVGGQKEGYLLSAKDLMLAGRIDELIKAGVDCFKIEGRLRRPEYVAESVRVYKRAISGKFNDSDLTALKKVFNRGDYTEGHVKNGTNKVLDIKICSHKGAYIGKVLKVGKTAKLDCHINKGDGIKFLRGGYEVGAASVAHSGNETGFEGNVRVGDEVYITTDSSFNDSVLARARKLPVKISADFDGCTLTVKCGNCFITTEIKGAQEAKNSPITNAEIESCFNKSEHFSVESAEVTGPPSFMPKSQLNELRRSAYELLKEAIIADYEKNMQVFSGNYQLMSDIISGNIDDFLNNRTIYMVESAEQITDEMEIIAVNPREYSLEYLAQFKPYFDKAILNLPCIARGKDMDVLKGIIAECDFKGYIVNNLYGVELVKDKPILLGYGLNLINDLIKAPKLYSFESDRINSDGYVYVKGNVPLMNFCHCEKKELSNGCENCRGYDITLSYEGRDFYLRRYKIHYCYGQLLNCSDLDISGKNVRRAFIDLSFKRTGLSTKGNYGRGLK